MGENAAAARTFREGRILNCHELLIKFPPKGQADAVLAAEVLNLIGKTDEAEEAANQLVNTKNLPDALLARCTTVLADCNWYAGDLAVGLELYRLAVTARGSFKGPNDCLSSTNAVAGENL